MADKEFYNIIKSVIKRMDKVISNYKEDVTEPTLNLAYKNSQIEKPYSIK